ncbi:MAG: nitrous oxide-stimulated promoter family protein [Sulfurimonas sp.]|jgi:predicted amidophosphoribosyltransferase|nr:nitrous oxide-stimulated promoter family protein [Sulfurimonas sp.]MDD5202490.1 nitrous oxide-stimulated promoter family protein [Sulfurimonas sp.]
MTCEKFEKELATLKKFFPLYCGDKHRPTDVRHFDIFYQDKKYSFELPLCAECAELLAYSFERLKACPYDEKPKCRTCAKPCYNKTQWKQVAAVMRYSGTKTKLLEIRDFFSLNT